MCSSSVIAEDYLRRHQTSPLQQSAPQGMPPRKMVSELGRREAAGDIIFPWRAEQTA